MALIKHGNNALSSVTAFPSAVPTGKPVLLSTVTASSSASIEFTSGIDSTYDIYQFEFVDIHPATNDVDFTFNLSTDGGSNYNVTKTTTYIWTYHREDDASAEIVYETGSDLAQSTGFQKLSRRIGGGTDESQCGTLQLFQPSSSVFVKHFLSDVTGYYGQSGAISSQRALVGGYGNTTSSVNAIKFQMSSGNIDAGTIKMYGITA